MSIFININVFSHLKLEIASAISASNEWKIQRDKKKGQLTKLTLTAYIDLPGRAQMVWA